MSDVVFWWDGRQHTHKKPVEIIAQTHKLLTTVNLHESKSSTAHEGCKRPWSISVDPFLHLLSLFQGCRGCRQTRHPLCCTHGSHRLHSHRRTSRSALDNWEGFLHLFKDTLLTANTSWHQFLKACVHGITRSDPHSWFLVLGVGDSQDDRTVTRFLWTWYLRNALGIASHNWSVLCPNSMMMSWIHLVGQRSGRNLDNEHVAQCGFLLLGNIPRCWIKIHYS